jgi:hypothetical protein
MALPPTRGERNVSVWLAYENNEEEEAVRTLSITAM